MGGLLAFRVGNYNNTAEREQFRFLCEQLKAHYEGGDEFCVFVGNYNIGCELDALFIKKEAIISIEFKNYGGNVVANENGEWTCDGIAIKGGARKTVLQQARINHSTVKRNLKALGVDKKQIKDVPHLVVFHQNICLDNKLSMTNKSWLHITDDAHFIEKIDDITCPCTDLDASSIKNLAELLNLNKSFYLPEFSNAKEPVAPSNVNETTSIPEWIDKLIYEELKGKYFPNHVIFGFNLNKEDVLIYLGTYFPRSYVEVYTLFEQLLCNSNYEQITERATTLSILDLGCGTGGDILGLLVFIDVISA